MLQCLSAWTKKLLSADAKLQHLKEQNKTCFFLHGYSEDGLPRAFPSMVYSTIFTTAATEFPMHLPH